MSHSEVQKTLDHFIQRASEALGTPGRAILLDWQMSSLLEHDARFCSRRGLSGQHAVLTFSSGPVGHDMAYGMECFRLELNGREISLVRICDDLSDQLELAGQKLWVVPADDYVRIYRHLRSSIRNQSSPKQRPPIMSPEEQRRLSDNTFGFLKGGRQVLRTYGVAQQRGILLLGPPGNGKTMACRWLLSECRQLGLAMRYVSAEMFDSARAHGRTTALFNLPSPGIILFDDFDLGMHDRNETGPTREHSILLSELDGVRRRDGVVFIFTTNAQLSSLDPAFLRRGRIDQVFQFPNPDASLRRRLLEEFWHHDIQSGVDLDQVTQATDGMSFADITELKKLLVLRYCDTEQWDWDWALQTFQQSATPAKTSQIGFLPEIDSLESSLLASRNDANRRHS